MLIGARMKAISAKALTLSNIVFFPTMSLDIIGLDMSICLCRPCPPCPKVPRCPGGTGTTKTAQAAATVAERQAQTLTKRRRAPMTSKRRKSPLRLGKADRKPLSVPVSVWRKWFFISAHLGPVRTVSPLSYAHCLSFISQLSIGNHSLDAFHATMKAS